MSLYSADFLLFNKDISAYEVFLLQTPEKVHFECSHVFSSPEFHHCHHADKSFIKLIKSCFGLTVVEEVLRFLTQVKVAEPQCRNTSLGVCVYLCVFCL